MSSLGIAIHWGLKEDPYSHSPLLPAIGEILPTDPSLLEQLVANRHAQFGSEITFYWCFPFWRLAAHLQSRGMSLSGLGDFISVNRYPDLIVQVDLPIRHSAHTQLVADYPQVPLVLMVAETPLERHAQHISRNLRDFKAVFSYNRDSLHARCFRPPFRFHRSTKSSAKRLKAPELRTVKCTYVGNAHSSGWRRNYQYNLGLRGWPLFWQYLQGWSVPFLAFWRDERHGAYGVRAAAVLAARQVFGGSFRLCGKGWSNGGSGWLSRLLPDRRLRFHCDELGLSPGDKVDALCDSTFTLACENYLGDPGYVSEKVFDAMAAGSIPIYIGAPESLPTELREVVIDLSGLPRSLLCNTSSLAKVFSQIAHMPNQELLQRQLSCLAFMDNHYEKLYGIGAFLKSFDDFLDDLV